MAISTMYPAMPGSPKTTLTADITADATSLTVADGNVLPAAPNILVIGDDENAEVIGYNAKSGNTVSGLVRALGGTIASAWATGAEVARNITSFDHDRFKENIEDLEANKANTADVYTQSEIDTALSEKANSSHSHGDITNAGAITAAATAIGSGDAIVITDNSDSDKIKKATITFDNSTATKALSQKGTWESFEAPIEDSGWQPLENIYGKYTSANKIYYRKIGKLVQVTCMQVKLVTALDTSDISVVIDNMPANFRPGKTAVILVNTYAKFPTSIVINQLGEMTFYKGNGNDTWSTGASINANGFYFTN